METVSPVRKYSVLPDQVRVDEAVAGDERSLPSVDVEEARHGMVRVTPRGRSGRRGCCDSCNDELRRKLEAIEPQQLPRGRLAAPAAVKTPGGR
jgi:hypothetical protein